MQLKEFTKSSLINQPDKIDLDVASRLGPAIEKNISLLERMCKLMPNSNELLVKLAEFKELISRSTPSSNVLEKQKVIDLYSSLHPQFGEATWAMVANQLKEAGYDKATIDFMIDGSITLI